MGGVGEGQGMVGGGGGQERKSVKDGSSRVSPMKGLSCFITGGGEK